MTWCVLSPSEPCPEPSAACAQKGEHAVELLAARDLVILLVLVTLVSLTMLALRATQR